MIKKLQLLFGTNRDTNRLEPLGNDPSVVPPSPKRPASIKGNVLDRLAADLAKSGLTGEDRAAKLIYLALTSRLLDTPLSLAVKGQSSSGKSYVVERVLEFFPQEAYWALTMMSPKAMLHSQRDIRHRFLILYEGAALKDQYVDYIVRSLLSEGRINYEYTDMEGGGTKTVEREGPTGFLTTTTKIALHPENETRLLSVPINDTPQQTVAVMKAIAEAMRLGPAAKQSLDLQPWRDFQHKLWKGERRVVVPFAVELVDLIPPVAVRLRRDISKVFTLIQSHALLHARDRLRDSNGCIIATVDDYEVVYDLVNDSVGEAVEATITPEIRQTVNAVAEIIAQRTTEPLGEESGVSITELGRYMNLHRGTASRRVEQAIKRGFLYNREDAKGKPAQVVLGDPLPEDVVVLPHPDKLRECCTVAR